MDARIVRPETVVAMLLALLFCIGCSQNDSLTELTATPSSTPQSTPVCFELSAAAPTMTPAPTPTPTPSPSPTPTPITEDMIDSGMFDSYFDNTVFVGDSITEAFKNYCSGQRKENETFLGSAKFLAGVSLSVRVASSNARGSAGIELKYRGKTVSVAEGLAQMEAERVFILLGVNDKAGKYPDETIDYYNKLLDCILEYSPDIEIVVQGLLPVTADFCKERHVTIDQWNSFNIHLRNMCSERGIAYFSFAEELMDENGYLPRSYSSDGQFHLNSKANAVWVHALRTYASQQLSGSDNSAPEAAGNPETLNETPQPTEN